MVTAISMVYIVIKNKRINDFTTNDLIQYHTFKHSKLKKLFLPFCSVILKDTNTDKIARNKNTDIYFKTLKKSI